MVRKYLTSLLLLASLSTMADTFPTLVVHMKSGAEQAYTVQESMKVRTTDDSLMISSEHINVAYSLNSVSKYLFLRDTPVGDGIIHTRISNSNGQLHFKKEGNNLIITGLPYDSQVRVFSVSSAEYHPTISYSYSDSSSSSAGNTATINFSELPEGAYLIVPTGCNDIPSLKFVNTITSK